MKRSVPRGPFMRPEAYLAVIQRLLSLSKFDDALMAFYCLREDWLYVQHLVQYSHWSTKDKDLNPYQASDPPRPAAALQVARTLVVLIN